MLKMGFLTSTLLLYILVGAQTWVTAVFSRNESGSVECSFLSEVLCGYENCFREESEPRWKRKKAPVGGDGRIHSVSQPNGEYEHIRYSVLGNFSMEWPPHGDYYISTGPTEEERFHGVFAEIESPEFQVTNGSKCLYFNYHNRLPFQLIPTLEVRIRMENTSDQVIASYLTLNSSKWFEAQVRLPIGEYRIVFAGKNYYRMFNDGGEVAVTNIAVLDGNCARSIPEWMERLGDCGFENGLEACGYEYTNDSTVSFLELRTEHLQISRTHHVPTDTFMAMTGKYHRITSHDSRSRIQSPDIVIELEGCLYLWYFNSVPSNNEENNALNILIKTQEGTEPTVLFRLPISKNKDEWYQLSGALPRGRFRLILEAIYTRDFRVDDYVGFDNVEIFNRSCLDLENLKDACVIAQLSGRSLCKNGGICSGSGKKSFRCACPENFYGDLCEFSYPCAAKSNPCQNGGSCMDDGRIGMSCQCSPGFTGHRCNKRRKCGFPGKAMKNAELVSFGNDTFQSVATFECLPGFIEIGILAATCNALGKWDLEGGCYEIKCQPPPDRIQNAFLLNVTNGQAKYGCQPGFMFLSEQDSLLTCTPPPKYEHSSYQTDGYDFNTMTDAMNGSWVSSYGHPNFIRCREMPSCGFAPRITNSILESANNKTYLNGTASYRCLDGFQVNVPTNGTHKTTFTLKCSDRWIPEVGNAMYECWAVPSCGKPPNITHGRVAKVIGDTGLNSSAVYRCNPGYRLIGIDTAICWAINTNRKQKWLEWQFVPFCEKTCPAKVGRQGNVTSVILQVTRCAVSHGGKPMCDEPFESSVKRKLGRILNKESFIFYGKDLCIAEKVTRVLFLKDETLGSMVPFSNTTRCKSFCLQQPSDIYHLTVYEEYFYKSSLQQYGYNFINPPFDTHQYSVGTNLIRRTFLKYVVRLFP